MNPRRLCLFFVWCLAGAWPLTLIETAQGQGTIQFLNSSLTRFQYRNCGTSPSTLEFAPAGTVVRVELQDSFGGFTSVGVPATCTAGGTFSGGVVYPIPGTTEGQTVWMRIKASYGGLDGYTATLPITLGPTAGPGTVVFQNALGTATNRFRPLLLQPLGICAGDALISGMRMRELVFTDPASEVSAAFKVTCFKAATTIVPSIVFETLDGTAVAGLDYASVSSTLRLDGPLQFDVNVRILPRPVPAGNKYFFVRFRDSSPTANPPITIQQWIADALVTSGRRLANATQIVVPAVSGWNYTLESTVDLIDWLPVPGANRTTVDGVTTFSDGQPDCCGHRFYRVRAE